MFSFLWAQVLQESWDALPNRGSRKRDFQISLVIPIVLWSVSYFGGLPNPIIMQKRMSMFTCMAHGIYLIMTGISTENAFWKFVASFGERPLVQVIILTWLNLWP